LRREKKKLSIAAVSLRLHRNIPIAIHPMPVRGPNENAETPPNSNEAFKEDNSRCHPQ
jgi:hypothetical protein